MRLPYPLLTALDSRMYHFWLQPVHYIIRMLHILSSAAFFGIELLFVLAVAQNLDRHVLTSISRFMMRPLHWSFAVVMATGVLLFFYDPVRVGSRAYLTPKLLAIALALLSARLGHRAIFRPIVTSERSVLPSWSGVFCIASCVLWIAVFVFSCFNTEGVPKVYLRHYF
ncbi:hypothetical protein AA0472_3031 [Acetobacter estunensis NRIC 0472]|nr:hypothetical protein AA0472_3031 [Acetobacter estunensis NRIC 0472]